MKDNHYSKVDIVTVPNVENLITTECLSREL